MQDRRRPDEPEQRERTRPEPTQRQRTREGSGRVRIPKIQYRFLKELEQKGVTEAGRDGAFAMADKIKRYPLEARDVMGSWERFTKTAIADFKAQRGDADERDAQHASYAVLFTAVRAAAPVRNVDDLREAIANVDGVLRARQRQDDGGGQRERSVVELQIDKTFERLKNLSPQLRGDVERNARDQMLEGNFADPQKARQALPEQVRLLQADANETNAMRVMVMSVIARAPEQRAMLAEVGRMRDDDRDALLDAARARVESYAPSELRLQEVRRDAIAAAVREAIEPSPRNHREALVLAQAREKIESLDDPTRTNLNRVGEELARDLAW